MRAWLVCGSLFALGCAGDGLPIDLGDDPLDRSRLSASLTLAHIAAVLEGPEDLTVEQLYRERPSLLAAPDPTPWLESMRHVVVLPGEEGLNAVPLRVLSYNVALLDRWYPFAIVRAPEIDARRSRSAEIVLSGNWDVVLLQEVWDTQDVERYQHAAEQAGYRIYAGSPRRHEEHGLAIAVRTALIDGTADEHQDETTFEAQRDIEDFPGPGISRGFLSWRFRLASTGRDLTVFNTHMSAFPEYSQTREIQARALGLATHRAEGEVIVGGDLNCAAYYRDDRYGEVDGEAVTDWWRNAQAYALLLHYGALQDAWAAAHGARDVTAMRALPPYAASFREVPLGDRARCSAVDEAFTATDCNSLYFEQYAGTEVPARIDHVLWRDPWGRIRVGRAEIVHRDPLEGESFELSDHYGVGVEFILPVD